MLSKNYLWVSSLAIYPHHIWTNESQVPPTAIPQIHKFDDTMKSETHKSEAQEIGRRK